jgi:CheY-like chemotaxis protein
LELVHERSPIQTKPGEGFPVLVADDEPLSRQLVASLLRSSGFSVVVAETGKRALDILLAPCAPRVAILDWMMPGLDGIEICKTLRSRPDLPYTYIILLTAKEARESVVQGLGAGADDFLTKPSDPEELRSRVRTGERILRLQLALETNLSELRDAIAHVKTLQGLLPICMHCKSIRDDSNTWHRIEAYIEKNSEVLFTHSLCKDCLKKHYPDYSVDEIDGSSSEEGWFQDRAVEK